MQETAIVWGSIWKVIHEIYKASETGRQKKETHSLVKDERIVHGSFVHEYTGRPEKKT